MNNPIRVIFIALFALTLHGCLLLPNNFDARMTLTKDGRYDFSYNGEMQFLAGDTPSGFGPPKKKAFDLKRAECSTYFDEDGSQQPVQHYNSFDFPKEVEVKSFSPATPTAETADAQKKLPRTEARECTKEELAELKEQEDASIARQQKEYDERSLMMSAIFGDAIPGNDEALTRFAKKLAKYDSWEKVEYLGDNKFAVEYRATGKFDRYFAFPVLPEASMQFPFFHIVQRADGALELVSPALASGTKGLVGMAMLGGTSRRFGDNETPEIANVKGKFTLVTDGQVLGNNAPDGFAEEGRRKIMHWDIGSVDASPKALIKLAK